MRLKKGELPELTGVMTNCKICNLSKDDALFKWQNGKRAGLVCRSCDLEKKRNTYATDENYRNSAVERARVQEVNPITRATWVANNQDRLKDRRKSYHLENRDRINEKSLKWYSENKESQLIKMKEYGMLNRDKNREMCRQYYENNKIEISRKNNEWRQKNKGLVLSYFREYNLQKAKRVPKWADKETIQKFYINRPEGFQVDHIIPLFGKLVSGLHVENNLQYLTQSENASKSNKFDPWTFDNDTI